MSKVFLKKICVNENGFKYFIAIKAKYLSGSIILGDTLGNHLGPFLAIVNR